MQDMLPKLQIVLANGPLSLDGLFSFNQRTFWLEVGFGGGEHLAAQAKAHPTIGFIGCEPFVNGVARLLKIIEQENLKNIRIYSDDARLLMDCIEDSKISSYQTCHFHGKTFQCSSVTVSSCCEALLPKCFLQLSRCIFEIVFSTSRIDRNNNFSSNIFTRI